MIDLNIVKISKDVVEHSVFTQALIDLLIEKGTISKQEYYRKVKILKEDDSAKKILKAYNDTIKLLEIFSTANFTDENKAFIKQYQDEYNIPRNIKLNNSTIDFLKFVFRNPALLDIKSTIENSAPHHLCNICYNWGIHGCELDVCSFVESKSENKGKWESGLWGYSCSCCGFGASESGLDNYCPNCGAKMEGMK